LFFIWLAFITLFSLLRPAEVPAPDIEIPHIDKLVHAIFYLVLVVLGCLWAREWWYAKFKLGKVVFVMVAAAIFYGMVIEAFQGLMTNGREADFYDVVANSVGAYLGRLVTIWYFLKFWSLKL